MTSLAGASGGGVPRTPSAPAGAPATAPPVRPEPSPARHCWVADAADGLGIRRAGLLVEWRQVGDAWQGRVVYAARVRPPHGWVLVEEWLPAALLTPL